MKKANAKSFIIISALIFSSCTTILFTSFLKKEDISNIKNYEKNEYILKADEGEGDYSVKKGTKVKLHMITGDDFIKVYCYPSNMNFVKTKRTLINYLFEDDFEKSKFNIAVFEKKLFEKVDPAGR
ncbi:MAG: type II secretion system-associated lipoprotein [Spirochaetes bacterium]|nr:type II secretion system-associated lipoprotein [Spirochaetota bacterium]